MKSRILLGTALLFSLGTLAHAQDMSGTSSTTPPPPHSADMPAAPAPATDAPAPSAPPSDMSVPAAAPEAPASAYMAAPQPAASAAASDDYPLCIKSITDHCMNPSEAPKGYAKKHSAK